MKLTKKIICVATVAAMSLTSLTAFATVPTPKDNTQAFIYAENYFNQGLYYEAMDELRYVNPIYTHESDKLAMWIHKVQERITAWEISEGFRITKELYDANQVVAAYNFFHGSPAGLGVKTNWASAGLPAATAYLGANSFTAEEAAQYDEWCRILDRGIVTEDQAIAAVENALNDTLWDPDMYYSVVPFGDGWDVYIKSYSTEHNLAAYHVARALVVGDADGDSTPGEVAQDGWVERVANVTRTDFDYNGNPASEYEWRYDSVPANTTPVYPEWTRVGQLDRSPSTNVVD